MSYLRLRAPGFPGSDRSTIPMNLARFLVIGLFAIVCHGAPSESEDKKSPDAPPVVKRLKAAVSTPLFIQQAAGVSAMANVTLTATATPTKPDAPGVVNFVPPLGPAGRAVLDSVSKYLVSMHHGWPAGHRIDIAFSVPIAPDDTAAAGLATATVLDSMMGGWESDPTCAVVGHLQADGKIQNVSGALSRLLTAMRAGASRILMPEKNVAEAAADCMVNEGANGFGRVQMFAVKDFDEIPMMAGTKLEPLMAESIAAFTPVQATLAAAGEDAAKSLQDPATKESLRTVLEKWPNHVNARLLLGYSIGRYKTFSVSGSVQAIERSAQTLLWSVTSGHSQDVRKVPPAGIAADLAALKVIAGKVDPKARPMVDHLTAYGEAAKTWLAQPPRTQNDAAVLAKTLSTEAALAIDERQKLARLIVK